MFCFFICKKEVLNDITDKDNSIFKIVIAEDYLEILPTKTAEKTTVTAKHNSVKAIEYEEGATSSDHFRYGEYNLTVNVTYGSESKEEKTNTYEVFKGEGQELNISDNGELEFGINIEYSKFQENGKVYIDGVLVDSSNYTSKEGSTIIKFNNNYVNDISIGEHTLKVAVADGEANTTFTIAKNPETTEIPEVQTAITDNPITGDNIIMYITLFAISLIGIVGIVVCKKINK